MKNVYYIHFAILVILLTGCSPKNAILEGKVINASGIPIVYNTTLDGIVLPNRFDTLHLNPDSTFRLILPINDNEKISFFLCGKRALGSVYLAPGSQNVYIDASKSNKLKPIGNFEKENEILRKLTDLNDNVFKLRASIEDVFDISRDTIAASIYQKLTEYASTMEQEITGVDHELTKRATQDIRMHILLAFMNQYFINSNKGSDKNKKKWNDSYVRMLEFVDINQDENVYSSTFADVISNVAAINIFSQDGTYIENENERNQIIFNWYKTNLQGRVQATAMGLLFIEDENSECFATEIPSLYEKYKKLYPNSILLPIVEKAVAKNKTFNEAELPDGINFLNTDSVHAFKDITSLFAGKVIYIDIWATWCGPCRASFADIKPLQTFADSNDVVLLYMSIDSPQKKELWKKMTGYYNLKGQHAIVNEAFKNEVYGLFGDHGYLTIPHYAIINKEGILQFPSAASPKDMDKLIEQLEEASIVTQ